MTRDDEAGGRRRAPADAGVSLVEILVAVVLLGTAVVAMLTALRTSVLGSTVHRDHSNAHAWLQSASDVLYAHEKADCSVSAPDAGRAAIVAEYQAVVNDVPNPETWTNSQIQVKDLQFWNAVDTDRDGVIEYRFGATCQDTVNLGLQRLTLQVTSPSGKIIEQVELIK